MSASAMLNLGRKTKGPFMLSAELAGQKNAIVGLSGSGKTCAAGVMMEEMTEAGIPCIVIDPIGVWWGRRAGVDGKRGGGLNCVIIGGEHGDVPLDHMDGRKLAHALTESPVCAVIDLFATSKALKHQFVADFCDELLMIKPSHVTHLIIEEAPVFIPQRTSYELTARCKAAVETLTRLGRNNGYGFTFVSQRPATVDKDVLSQVENLLVMRTNGKHDRKALSEWIEANASDKQLEKMLGKLASLDSGEGYFWSPKFAQMFERVTMRRLTTFHPGETRKVGAQVTRAELRSIPEAVAAVKGAIEKAQAKTQKTRGKTKDASAVIGKAMGAGKAGEEIEVRIAPENPLLKEVADLRVKLARAEGCLARVRELVRPEYETLKALFEEVKPGEQAGGSVNDPVWVPWLKKAGVVGARKVLTILIERGSCTQAQLATLAGLSKEGTFRNYRAWLTRNGLAKVEGEQISLVQP